MFNIEAVTEFDRTICFSYSTFSSGPSTAVPRGSALDPLHERHLSSVGHATNNIHLHYWISTYKHCQCYGRRQTTSRRTESSSRVPEMVQRVQR